MKAPSRNLLAAVAAALVISGCGKKAEDSEPAPSPGSSQPALAGGGDPIATSKAIFNQRCVVCHGATGAGDGPASESLNPKPRKYTDVEWQASVTDEYIEKIIKFGGAAVGKSPAMPNNPDLNPAVVTALKDIVRSFGKK